MELRLGNRVRSGGRRIGYLAGVEVDAASRRVTKIIFSEDGKLGSHAQSRPIELVRVEGSSLTVGEPMAGQKTAAEPLLLSRSVRVTRGGRQAGHVAGVVVGDNGALEAAIGKQHWWSGRFRIAAANVDLSFPGEIRTGGSATRAA